jgi:hypothetical protein
MREDEICICLPLTRIIFWEPTGKIHKALCWMLVFPDQTDGHAYVTFFDYSL